MTIVTVVDLSPVIVAEKIRGYAIVFTVINFKTGYY